MKAKEILTKYLDKIGWNLKHSGAEHYIICDHDGNETDFVLWDVAITTSKTNYTIHFEIAEENMTMISNTTLSIGNKNNFVLFMNFDIKED